MHGVHGRIKTKKEKDIAAHLQFAKDHMDEPDGCLNNDCYWDE